MFFPLILKEDLLFLAIREIQKAGIRYFIQFAKKLLATFRVQSRGRFVTIWYGEEKAGVLPPPKRLKGLHWGCTSIISANLVNRSHHWVMKTNSDQLIYRAMLFLPVFYSGKYFSGCSLTFLKINYKLVQIKFPFIANFGGISIHILNTIIPIQPIKFNIFISQTKNL